MAVTTIPIACQMLVNVSNDLGTGSVARRYQDVKPNAADADIFSVANDLAQLQTRDLVSIQKTVTSEISDS